MKHRELQILGQRLSPFVVGAEGNISQRLGFEGFTIKASGKSMKDMDDDSFVSCDMDGNPLPDQAGKPSMEAGFHAWIYKNSHYSVVAHTHPTNVLKILCTDWVHKFACVRLFPDQVVFNGSRACIIPYATPGEHLTRALKDATLALDSLPSLFLLKNHGIICCAHTGQQAAIMTEVCEKAAEVFIGTKLLDGPVFLSEEQVSAIQKHKGEIYRREMS